MSGAPPRIDRVQAITDGNGWKLVDNGVQRRWHKHWTDVALPVAVDGALISGDPLPVAVATLGAVDRHISVSGRGVTGPYVVGILSGDDTTTTITVRATTTDGANLSTKSSGLVNIAVELVERLP